MELIGAHLNPIRDVMEKNLSGLADIRATINGLRNDFNENKTQVRG